MSGQIAVWWIRRDLRLHDNQALHAAVANESQVIPLFILDPQLWTSPYVGPKRLSFLLDGLRKLDAALREKGSRLILREGEPVAELSAVLKETGASTIYSEEDISPYARKRDEKVKAVLPLELTAGLTILPVGLIRKKDGDPYTVYTPFSKVWKSLPMPQEADLLTAPARIDITTKNITRASPARPSMNSVKNASAVTGRAVTA